MEEEKIVVYYQSDRKQIKAGHCNPAGIREYIEALEAVARAATAYYFNGTPETSSDLHDALELVDWMQEDE